MAAHAAAGLASALANLCTPEDLDGDNDPLPEVTSVPLPAAAAEATPKLPPPPEQPKEGLVDE